MRNLGALILSLAYMLALSLFLSFVAVWVCDGYYPVGWGWKGLFLHGAFWAMPVSLILGSILAASAIRPNLSIFLLLIGTVPFVAALVLVETVMVSPITQTQSSSLHLRLLGVVLSIGADVILIRWAKNGHRGSSQIASS